MSLCVEPDPSLRRFDGGRTVVGGSPWRVLRLSTQGADLLTSWLDGTPVTVGESLARRLVQAGMLHPRYTAPPFGPGDVTVVVPVHGPNPARLRAELAGLPVIVVDDASPEPIPGALRHDVRRGPAAARNTGWRHARTPLVVFLDADTLPEPGWLDPLLAHLADPEVAAVAPRVRSTPGESALARYETQRSPLDLGAQPGPVRPGARVSYVPTAALLIRREVLAEHDGFDDSMRFGEDVDLLWRITASRSVRYEPRSVVEHTPRASWALLLRQRCGYGCSAGPLGVRHGAHVTPMRLSVWSLLTWILVVLGRFRLAALVTGVAAVLLTRKLNRVRMPVRESVRLAVQGNLGAARLVLDLLGRSWAPVALPVLVLTRRGRRILALITARHLLDWWAQRPGLDPLRYVLARVADDAAYGCGVLCGSLAAHDRSALTPVFTDVGARSSVPVGR